ncbi:TPA: hypothetical protein MH565_04415 [Klebsiella pneumoniae]|jgi:hypothetical protein|uniref:Secreted protein n=1 Tax=Klebsiella pneumoniae TaxID=573 RepID=A0A2L1BWV3_KLEPN|nr:hypothetical protein Kpn23412_1829 [Klebsiella pneumoniae subsp. pneumoniae]APM18409.1 hypothetical protein AGG42_03040 [Klebsiella pneumoniae]EKF78216.1 Hypothetical protein B819_98540 [Klebsiella pneumoniae subsp. pneumoniae KpQ3]ESL64576.1 hypothetical protein L458_02424 [Klebsiella pneumoniae BIDMC 22]ESM01002.1 hypothetical protein L417_02343 [Klebsiella pneumoniae UCICRE 6]ESM02926.1 hypothetical protein L418_01919 [Klebsiella pneumoniae UCICRE 7]ESM29921.1 hypothetical protein L413_
MLARQLTCTPGLFRCRFFLFSALVYGSTFATSPSTGCDLCVNELCMLKTVCYNGTSRGQRVFD